MPLLAQACTLCVNNSTLGVDTQNLVFDIKNDVLGTIINNPVFDTKINNPVFDTNKITLDAVTKKLVKL